MSPAKAKWTFEQMRHVYLGHFASRWSAPVTGSLYVEVSPS